MLPKEYSAAAKKIEALQAELDKLITDRIHERAVEISGVPVLVLRRMLEQRSCGYQIQAGEARELHQPPRRVLILAAAYR